MYAHYEKNAKTNETTKTMISWIKQIASNISNNTNQGFSVDIASDDLKHTPPSSFWAFYEKNPNINGIVLTDHDRLNKCHYFLK